MLRAKRVESGMIARSASGREMRAASETLAATGGPQVRSRCGTIVTVAITFGTVDGSSSFRPSTLETLFALRARRRGLFDRIFTEQRVDLKEKDR